jgi:cell division cycle 14
VPSPYTPHSIPHSHLQILELGFSADDAWKPLRNLYPAFPPFRDASYGLCTFGITLLDCFRGIQKAVQCGFINFSAFNVEQ